MIGPLGLSNTYLPAPGHRSIDGRHAHGYLELDGKTVDLTRIDPSVAGAAGGGALVTTVDDVSRFLDALLQSRLFRHHTTLREMLTFAPAPDQGGQVGYGLGIERRLFPGGVKAIGHLGGAGTYTAYVGRLRPQDVTIALALPARRRAATARGRIKCDRLSMCPKSAGSDRRWSPTSALFSSLLRSRLEAVA